MTVMSGNAQDNAVKGNKYPALKSGDYVKFGNYPQNHGDIKEPIEWVVLEVKDNEALLISRTLWTVSRIMRRMRTLPGKTAASGSG